MKKLLPLILAICAFAPFLSQAQSFPPQALVYGASPFTDSLYTFNASTFDVVGRFSPKPSAGDAITGITAMAFDPCGLKMYVVAKQTNVTGRVLGTYDITSDTVTIIGDLGDRFSSITFSPSGQLYGMTGQGATVSHTLYAINKADATKTLLVDLPNGADGDVICYNNATNEIFHWSGGSTQIFEKVSLTSPYPTTNIPTTGTAGGETFGAMYLAPDSFLTSNIASQFNIIKTDGTWSTAFGLAPNDMRGLAMPPVFAVSEDTVCPKYDTITVAGAATRNIFQSIIYNWGDGHIDTVTGGNVKHAYAAGGNYTLSVSLYNGSCSTGTYWTQKINVKNVPVVTITGATNLCPDDTIILTGSSGGSSQWFYNGGLIPNATSNTYAATQAGVYNMIKTNQNGCYDSAAVGKTILAVQPPVVSLGNDVNPCGSATLNAGNNAVAYLWSDNSTASTLTVTIDGTYAVTVTDNNGCTAVDDINVTIKPKPIVTLNLPQTTACLTDGPITLSGGAPAGGSYTGNGVSGTTFTPTTAGSVAVSYIFIAANSCTDTAIATITVNNCTGINDLKGGIVNLYPNPAANFVTLSANGISGDIQVQIADVTGRIMSMYNDNISSDMYTHTFDVSTLAAGNYIVRVNTANGSASYSLSVGK